MGKEYVARRIVFGGMDGQGITPLPVFVCTRAFRNGQDWVTAQSRWFLEPRSPVKKQAPFLRSGCRVAFEQAGQIGEGCEGAIRFMVRRRFVRPAADLIALMLVVVAIEAEQLPVAAVGRIIVMVVVLVMDRELAQFLAVKFAPAVGANPGE